MERHTKNIQEPRGAVRDIQHSRYSRKSNIVCKHFLKVTSWHEWVGSKLHHWVLTQALLPRSLQTLSQSLIPHQAKHHIWTYIYIYTNILHQVYVGIWLHYLGLSDSTVYPVYPYLWTVNELIPMISATSATAEIAFGGLTAIFSKLRGCIVGNLGNLSGADSLGMQWSIYGRFVAKHV